MSEPIIKAVLRKEKKKGDGRIPVYLRVQLNGTTSYLSMEFAVRAKDWTKLNQGRVKKGPKGWTVFNGLIKEKRGQIQDIWLERQEFSRRNTLSKNLNSAVEGRHHWRQFRFFL